MVTLLMMVAFTFSLVKFTILIF